MLKNNVSCTVTQWDFTIELSKFSYTIYVYPDALHKRLPSVDNCGVDIVLANFVIYCFYDYIRLVVPNTDQNWDKSG